MKRAAVDANAPVVEDVEIFEIGVPSRPASTERRLFSSNLTTARNSAISFNVPETPTTPYSDKDHDEFDPRKLFASRRSTYSFCPSETQESTKIELVLGMIHDKLEFEGFFSRLPDHDPYSRIVASTQDEVLSTPNTTDDKFERNVEQLGVRVAARLANEWTKQILDGLNKHSLEIDVGFGRRIQVLDSLDDLPTAKRYQFAAFVRKESSLVIWSEGFSKLFALAKDIEQKVIDAIWSDTNVLVEKAAQLEMEVDTAVQEIKMQPREHVKPRWWQAKRNKPEVKVQVTSMDGRHSSSSSTIAFDSRERQTILVQPIAVATVWLVLGVVLGLTLRKLIQQYLLDGSFYHFLLLLMMPLSLFFGMFVFQYIICNTFQLFGPVDVLNINSKTCSGIRPSVSTLESLPHITIQMPVYKESLPVVLDPAIQSVLRAISTYELQGGSASIFINDDGMQLLDSKTIDIRKKYYDMHRIAWIARPPHGRDGFERAGKFKKASNMNFALHFSKITEERFLSYKSNFDDPTEAYNSALEDVLAENPSVWADGDIRIGEHILLIDSDTIIPEDCFLDAAAELDQSPDVAILQHSSGVLKVANNFWEDGMAYLNEIVYRSIRFACACGDVAPFVGHNAFLRWSAVQELEYTDASGRMKWWAEDKVSEDFELSLRLQCLGYKTRLATYSNDEFKEGVSLTVYDELNRWRKYAYGSAELMFNPFRYWLTKSPFTALFRSFVRSRVPGFAKFTVIAYMGTYFAIASSWILVGVNYIASGLFLAYLDRSYLNSWNILFFCLIVFNGYLGLCMVIYRYRIKECSLASALLEVVVWTPFLILFFSGLSLHLSKAILSHFLGIPITFGATAKELEESDFWHEIPKVISRFWRMYVLLVVVIVGMIAMGTLVPDPYIIPTDRFFAWVPVAQLVAGHALVPIVLNSQLLRFNY